MIKVTRGKRKRPLRVVTYGTEGVGKTVFTSAFPEPLFIDTENGTDTLDVARTQTPKDWNELLQIVKDVAADPTLCRTLVVDTGDWAETLCIKHICEKYKKSGLEEFGYGKGYVYLREEFSSLLDALDDVIDAGINVAINAHAHIRKFEQPDEMGAYDRWELKMSKNVAPLVKEWCDILLFANYKTYVVKTDEGFSSSNKAQGGKRVMYATHSPCWDAKNRHGLPDEMELEFRCIAHLFEGVGKPDKTALMELRSLMEKEDVTDAELVGIVAGRKKAAADVPIDRYDDALITGWIIPNWDKILKLITGGRNAAKAKSEGGENDG